MKTIVAICTCHNRREKTLASIASFFDSSLPVGFRRQVVLVDDGSSDGTAEAVVSAYPDVLIVRGDGSLFWCRGMLLAWRTAFNSFQPDYYLWLNDDTLLHKDALERLLACDSLIRHQAGSAGISVGATEDGGGRLTYGGAVCCSAWNKLKTVKKFPSDQPQRIDTFNGNCVLLPREVCERVGYLDGVFEHAMGDVDYGFRASGLGVVSMLAAGFCGICTVEPRIKGTYNDTSLTLARRWKDVMAPKGLPLKPWLTLCKRHAGFIWPFVWAWPYFRIMLTTVFPVRL